MKFEVTLDIEDDELSEEQLAEAIKSALSTLELSNNDTLYIDSSAIEVTPKE